MKTILKIFISVFILSSCGGGKDNPPEPEPEAKELGAFNLVFPDNNLICTEGIDVGTEEVSIGFLWSESANATSYDIQITNQETSEIINQSSTAPEKTVTLKKNTQYSWEITAKLNEVTKTSTVWNFYTEGIAVENYAPFPAEISFTDNSNGTVNISWVGSDLDDDIQSFDVYLGTEPEPNIYLTDTELVEIVNYEITTNIVYYIKIVTKDAAGNSSTSKALFTF